MRSTRLSTAASIAAAFVVALIAAQSAPAQTYKVLHKFSGGVDGGSPFAGVIQDSKGKLYGTASQGGNTSCSQGGCGVVFRLSETGKQTVLYSFPGGTNGQFPYAGVKQDTLGNLYGTTKFDGGAYGWGNVFKLSKTGKETVLYSFTGGSDGGYPSAGVVEDDIGNLYGTTSVGGNQCQDDGCGVVFKLNKSGKETVLYHFSEDANGWMPEGELIRDANGNLYGTTFTGGSGSCTRLGTGCGVVFKLSKTGKQTVLYRFTGGADGGSPAAGVIQDANGNLYGTTVFGGSGNGTVFKLSKSGKETVLYSFKGGTDGIYPRAGVIRDAAGTLYGTTNNGGAYGFGTVFKLSKTGKETVLHSFTGGADGALPSVGLIEDAQGNLYGTTSEGGDPSCSVGGGGLGCGVVFKMKP